MADNSVIANPGVGGATFASDQIGGIEFPRAKVVWGADGTATDVSASDPLPVVQIGTPALPTGAATESTLAAASAKLPATLGQKVMAASLSVALASDQSALSVSAASLPLPALAATSTKQSDGSQKTQIVDGSGNVIGATSNALDVNIKSGGGAGGTSSNFGSAIPAAGTAAGASDGTNMQIPRVFDLDSGAGTQYGLGVNLRQIASGGSVEAGIAANPLRVDPTGTTTQPVSIATAPALVASSAVIGKVGIDQTTPGTTNLVALAANQSVNAAQINGVTPLMGNGVTGTGSQRVTIASDNTAFGVNLAQYTPATGRLPVDPSGVTSPVSLASVPSHPVTNAGTFPVQADGSVASGSADSGNPLKVGGKYNSSPITLTNGQRGDAQLDANGFLKVNVAAGGASGGTSSSFGSAFPATGTALGAKDSAGTNMAALNLDASGNLKVNLAAGGGSGGTALSDKAAFTEGSTSMTPIGGVLNETISADPTEDQAAAVRITAKRALHVNLRDSAGNELTAGAQYAEDSVHASGDQVTVAGVVRKDTATQLAGTDGDYSVLTNDASGRLHVNVGAVPADPFGANADAASATGSISAKLRFIAATGIPITNTVTVAAHAVTNAGTFATQDSEKVVDNAAFTDGTTKVQPVGFIFDEVAGAALTENDAGAARMDSKRAIVNVLEDATTRGQRAAISAAGALSVTDIPATSGGWTPSTLLSAATTNATSVKASAGQVGGWYLYNANAAVRYLKLYNKASAPTVGTDVPVMTIPIPPGSAANVEYGKGIAFPTGIAFAITTGPTTGDTGAVALNEIIVNLLYK